MPDPALETVSAIANRLASIRGRFPDAEPNLVVELARAVLGMSDGDPGTGEASLLAEVEDLSRTIASAKAEIAALRVDDITHSQIPSATDELDAIVAHTAAATHCILETCETLDRVAVRLAGEPAAQLQHATTRIYEACSFQDITGQRITKVVATLKTIDTKVARMLATFGAGVARPSRPDPSAGASQLLNGPQLRSAAMDQVGHRQAAGRHRLMRTTALLAAGLLCLSVSVAHAENDPEVRVRTGDHPGFGRVVFNFQVPVSYRLTRENGLIHLQFDHAGRIGSAASTPRNVQRITGGDGEAEIQASAGARIRPMRVGTGIVIDVLDPEQSVPARAVSVPPGPPAHAAPSPPSARTPTAAPAPATPVRRPASESPAEDTGMLTSSQPPKSEAPAAPRHGADQVADKPAPVAIPSEPPPSESVNPAPAGPVALVAARLKPPPGSTASMFSLPFGADTGLAAFRRGETVLLVFDESRPVDLEALHGDPVFGSAAVQLLPAAAVIEFRPPPGTELAFSRSPTGWTVTAEGAAPSIQPIGPVLVNQEITFAAAAPGRVVNVADPETGGTLLVGTQRQPGQAVLVGRQTAEFALLPSWQGLVVDPLADSMFLHVAQSGFLLGVDLGGLALAPPTPDEAAYAGATTLTRRYDFPPLSTQDLMQRLRADIDAAAAAAPLARGPMRRAAARTMIALGLGAEAQAMLRLAVANDAREAENPDTIGLLAIAATARRS